MERLMEEYERLASDVRKIPNVDIQHIVETLSGILYSCWNGFAEQCHG